MNSFFIVGPLVGDMAIPLPLFPVCTFKYIHQPKTQRLDTKCNRDHGNTHGSRRRYPHIQLMKDTAATLCPPYSYTLASFFFYLYVSFSLFLSFSISLSYGATGQGRGLRWGTPPPWLRRVQIVITSLPIDQSSPNLQKMKAKSKAKSRFWRSKLHQSMTSMWKI